MSGLHFRNKKIISLMAEKLYTPGHKNDDSKNNAAEHKTDPVNIILKSLAAEQI